MAHDAVVTPLDLVKQRMQVYPQLYPTLRSTIASTYRASGLRGFYASYPVTVAMNVPHMSAYFAAYESLKLMLSPDNSEAELGPVQHLLAGGGAGAIAACVSTPLDVVKTRLQLSSALSASATSSASAPLGAMSAARAAVSTAATASTASAAAFSSSAPHLAPPSISEIIRHIYAAEGWRGFTRGMTARMLYFAPSAAICWTTYEAAKAVLMASE
jgi:solute carrier family 25 iron transporter 28/37